MGKIGEFLNNKPWHPSSRQNQTLLFEAEERQREEAMRDEERGGRRAEEGEQRDEEQYEEGHEGEHGARRGDKYGEGDDGGCERARLSERGALGGECGRRYEETEEFVRVCDVFDGRVCDGASQRLRRVVIVGGRGGRSPFA